MKQWQDVATTSMIPTCNQQHQRRCPRPSRPSSFRAELLVPSCPSKNTLRSFFPWLTTKLLLYAQLERPLSILSGFAENNLSKSEQLSKCEILFGVCSGPVRAVRSVRQFCSLITHGLTFTTIQPAWPGRPWAYTEEVTRRPRDRTGIWKMLNGFSRLSSSDT